MIYIRPEFLSPKTAHILLQDLLHFQEVAKAYSWNQAIHTFNCKPLVSYWIIHNIRGMTVAKILDVFEPRAKYVIDALSIVLPGFTG